MLSSRSIVNPTSSTEQPRIGHIMNPPLPNTSPIVAITCDGSCGTTDKHSIGSTPLMAYGGWRTAGRLDAAHVRLRLLALRALREAAHEFVEETAGLGGLLHPLVAQAGLQQAAAHPLLVRVEDRQFHERVGGAVEVAAHGAALAEPELRLGPQRAVGQLGDLRERGLGAVVLLAQQARATEQQLRARRLRLVGGFGAQELLERRDRLVGV